MFISLNEACERLKAGEVIAAPTETVYGLVADIYNPKALTRIFELKGRSFTKPLSMFISSTEEIRPLITHWPPVLDKANLFWPGPFTLVFEANVKKVNPLIRASQSTVGFRMPHHPQTLALLQAFGPLAAPSANPSGLKEAQSAAEVTAYFGEDFPILEGEVYEKQAPSTVIEILNKGARILRKGATPIETLEKWFGPLVNK